MIQPRDILLYAGGAACARYGPPWRRLRSAFQGGDQAIETFTRATVGNMIGPAGQLQSAASGALRTEFVDLDGDGIRETPTLVLEDARTQLVTNPENFGAWSVSGTPIVTGSQADPFGGTAAYELNDDDGAVNEFIFQTVTFTGDAIKGLALFVRAGTAGETIIKLRDTTGAADRLLATITWTAGVPAVVMTTGTLLANEALGGNWYRLVFQTTSVTAANVNRIEIAPAGAPTNTGTVYVFGANAWNALFPSSYQGPSLGTRNADSLGFTFSHRPQTMTAYTRFVEAGSILLTAGFPQTSVIGAGTDPRWIPSRCDNSNNYQSVWRPTSETGDQKTSTSPGTPVFGDLVEHRSVLWLAGSDVNTQIHESINGAAETSGALGTSPLGFPTAFGVAQVYLNGFSTAIGFGRYHALIIVRGTPSIADFRALL